jgi:hypothetical protein
MALLVWVVSCFVLILRRALIGGVFHACYCGQLSEGSLACCALLICADADTRDTLLSFGGAFSRGRFAIFQVRRGGDLARLSRAFFMFGVRIRKCVLALDQCHLSRYVVCFRLLLPELHTDDHNVRAVALCSSLRMSNEPSDAMLTLFITPLELMWRLMSRPRLLTAQI